MWKIIVGRAISIVPVMFIVSVMAFSLVQLVPGDPATTLAGDSATLDQINAIRESLGLSQPLPLQYLTWLGKMLTGDMGESLFSNQAVTQAISERLPATLSLIIGALIVAIVLGLPLGILAGAFRGRWPDKLTSGVSAAGMATPSYVVGLVLIIVIANSFGWLPPTGYSSLGEGYLPWLQHLILPSIALGLVPAAILARQLRSALIGVLTQDYIRTARAKGMPEYVVLLKHALKNGAIPGLTALSTQMAVVIGSTVMIEQIFGIPGLGALAYGAALQRDMPMVQGVVLVSAIGVQVINLGLDVTYGWLNPKLRKA